MGRGTAATSLRENLGKRLRTTEEDRLKESGEHDGRPPGPGRSPEHEPDLLRLRPCVGGEPAGSGHLPVRLLRTRQPRRCQCGQEHTQGGARPSRLFAGATRRVRRLTLQAGESIPVSDRGDGRKESPSLPLSRRAKREGGENVKKEGYQKGFQIGYEAGLQESRQEGRRDKIERLHRKTDLSPDRIAEVLEGDPGWVAAIARSIEDRNYSGS